MPTTKRAVLGTAAILSGLYGIGIGATNIVWNQEQNGDVPGNIPLVDQENLWHNVGLIGGGAAALAIGICTLCCGRSTRVAPLMVDVESRGEGEVKIEIAQEQAAVQMHQLKEPLKLRADYGKGINAIYRWANHLNAGDSDWSKEVTGKLYKLQYDLPRHFASLQESDQVIAIEKTNILFEKFELTRQSPQNNQQERSRVDAAQQKIINSYIESMNTIVAKFSAVKQAEVDPYLTPIQQRMSSGPISASSFATNEGVQAINFATASSARAL